MHANNAQSQMEKGSVEKIPPNSLGKVEIFSVDRYS